MFLRLYPTEKLLYLPFELSTLRTRFGISNDKNEASSTSIRSKMTLSPKSLAGPGYIILNTIRVMNIISFLAVIAASTVMLVKISTDTKLWFFDAVSHVATAVSSIFLITSELSLFRAYFARNWPLLSPRSGFVFLALTMIILGVNILGNLNQSSNSQARLGLPFWRIVIASGVVVFVLGWINLVASYVFREREEGGTVTSARQVRAKGASVHKTRIVAGAGFYGSGSGNGSVMSENMTPGREKSCASSSTTPRAAGGVNTAKRKSPSPFNPFRFSSSANHNTTTTVHPPPSQQQLQVNRDSWLPSYYTAAAASVHHPSRSTSSSSSTASSDHHKPGPWSHHSYTNSTNNNNNNNPTPPPPESPTSRYSRATACTKKKLFGGFGNFGTGFGGMGWNHRSSLLAPPVPVNSYHQQYNGGGGGGGGKEMEISAPMGINPQFRHLVGGKNGGGAGATGGGGGGGIGMMPEVRRPDSALHPIRSRGGGHGGGTVGEAFRWRV